MIGIPALTHLPDLPLAQEAFYRDAAQICELNSDRSGSRREAAYLRYVAIMARRLADSLAHHRQCSAPAIVERWRDLATMKASPGPSELERLDHAHDTTGRVLEVLTRASDAWAASHAELERGALTERERAFHLDSRALLTAWVHALERAHTGIQALGAARA